MSLPLLPPGFFYLLFEQSIERNLQQQNLGTSEIKVYRFGSTSKNSQLKHIVTWHLGYWVPQKVHSLKPSKKIQKECFLGESATNSVFRWKLDLAWPGWLFCSLFVLKRHHLMLVFTYEYISLIRRSGWAKWTKSKPSDKWCSNKKKEKKKQELHLHYQRMKPKKKRDKKLTKMKDENT